MFPTSYFFFTCLSAHTHRAWSVISCFFQLVSQGETKPTGSVSPLFKFIANLFLFFFSSSVSRFLLFFQCKKSTTFELFVVLGFARVLAKRYINNHQKNERKIAFVLVVCVCVRWGLLSLLQIRELLLNRRRRTKRRGFAAHLFLICLVLFSITDTLKETTGQIVFVWIWFANEHSSTKWKF